MSFHTNSRTIPVFVVFQRDENDDDVDSVISFATGSSCSDRDASGLVDSESRWALEGACAAAAALQQQQRRRPSSARPHHPERQASSSNNNNNSPNSGACRPRVSVPTRMTSTPKRTTRLTRMAERAKAVARTPVARKKSFQRHSLPSVSRPTVSLSHSSSGCSTRPVRRKSSSLGSRRSSLGSPRSLCVDCSCQSHCSSSSLSPCKSAMIPIRRNSIQCLLPSPTATTTTSRRDGVLCPTRSTGRGLEAMILRQRVNPNNNSTNTNSAVAAAASARRVSGCFQIACAAANANRPPRLPQRHPSEAAPQQIPASN